MTDARLSPDGRTLTIHVPMSFKTRGGRKLVITPDGVPSWAKPRTRIDNTMVKALARAFRWRKLLEVSVYATIEEIARAEKINTSYISRILRLTLLAPDIVEMILDGRQPPTLTMTKLAQPFPLVWAEQRHFLEIQNSVDSESRQSPPPPLPTGRFRLPCERFRSTLDRRIPTCASQAAIRL